MDHAASPPHTARHALTPRVALVVVDLDTPNGAVEATPSELDALRALSAHGFALAIASACSRETIQQGIARLLAPTAIHMLCDVAVHASPRSNRADGLARLCQELNISFEHTAVIATSPRDAPLALEAGLVLAVADAGPACLTVADALFPTRSAGGIQQCARFLLRKQPGA